ncbi:protein of unknown function [Dyadobacter koreensis]|uniref:Uncharacterized protein n=1 Tax=Dyadobacter koreensis TaxID=408657 RepID=A0A1H6UWJ3_9BACT|nr:DUF4105 domain-containing protein [Dyadobacter koreensis]SEI92332.1 protein of unknown function [Dyadobacter koreensis]
MKLWILLFFIALKAPALGQNKLSPNAEISIITCGPDQDELYSAFGHSALRVKDPATGLDLVYNYGVFKFDAGFYINFIRGELFYKLGVSRFESFVAFYIHKNRYVHEQLLNLTATQKQSIFNYLEENAKPENATYRYDYFYNNCATKVRDVLVGLFGKQLKFNEHYATPGYTIRMLTGDRLRQQRWGKLAIDLCLGLPMDKKLSLFEYMFLPDYLESGFDNASISGIPLVLDKTVIFNASKAQPTESLFQPWVVFGIFLMITVVISKFDLKRNQRSKWFDLILYPVVGSVGILLLFLWFATDHEAASNNLNLLWACPLHILVPVLTRNKQYYFLLKPYLVATLVLLVMTFPFSVVMSAQLNSDLIAILIILYIRSLTLLRLMKKTILT